MNCIWKKATENRARNYLDYSVWNHICGPESLQEMAATTTLIADVGKGRHSPMVLLARSCLLLLADYMHRSVWLSLNLIQCMITKEYFYTKQIRCPCSPPHSNLYDSNSISVCAFACAFFSWQTQEGQIYCRCIRILIVYRDCFCHTYKFLCVY